MPAFETALKAILHEEGGYVNSRLDPGGRTNLGVTQHTWESWTGKAATEADMRALTPASVAPLYKARYWDAIKGDDLPAALALCVFDFAVNAGPARSARYLQTLVGSSRDGQIGAATIAAVNAFVKREGLAAAVRGFQQARRTYYHQLGTFGTFGRGWLSRVDRIETEALKLT